MTEDNAMSSSHWVQPLNATIPALWMYVVHMQYIEGALASLEIILIHNALMDDVFNYLLLF